MNRFVSALAVALSTAAAVVVFSPAMIEAQIESAECKWYCRSSDPHESGWYQCDNWEITGAPCLGTWIFGIACSSGCDDGAITQLPGERLQELSSQYAMLTLDGSVIANPELSRLLEENPEWGGTVDDHEGWYVIRSSCGRAILARWFSDPEVEKARDASEAIAL